MARSDDYDTPMQEHELISLNVTIRGLAAKNERQAAALKLLTKGNTWWKSLSSKEMIKDLTKEK
jgi:hypothetical protein